MKNCDFCSPKKPATIDGKINMGPWAYMCDACHAKKGVGLGVGKGRRLERQKAAK